MKVSIVTPNYNGKKFLKKYFESLSEDSEYIDEVIIVDNASYDGSIEYIEKSDFNFKVHLIKNTKNLGFAPAVNQGILKAKNEYIFSLNNDTEIKIGSIKAMLDLIASDDNIASVQSKMLQHNNKNLIDDAGDEYNLLGWTKKRGEGQNSNDYTEPSEIFSSCAGAALYKKSILIEEGLFDDKFFAYMEDVDLALRFNLKGYKNMLCPDAVVYHIGSATSGSRYNEFKVRLASRNNVWTVYKNLPIILKILNFIFLFLGFSIKYLFFLKKGFGKAYFSGVREGLKRRDELEKVKNIPAKNYLKLEYKLIINTIKFLKK